MTIVHTEFQEGASAECSTPNPCMQHYDSHFAVKMPTAALHCHSGETTANSCTPIGNGSEL